MLSVTNAQRQASMSINHLAAANGTHGKIANPPNSFRDDSLMKGLIIATANRQRTTNQNLTEYRAGDFSSLLSNLPLEAGLTVGPVHGGPQVSQIPPPSLTLREAIFGVSINTEAPRCLDSVEWRTYDLGVVRALSAEIKRREYEKWKEEHKDKFAQAETAHAAALQSKLEEIEAVRKEWRVHKEATGLARQIAEVRRQIKDGEKAEENPPPDWALLPGGGFHFPALAAAVNGERVAPVNNGRRHMIARVNHLEARCRIEDKYYLDKLTHMQEEHCELVAKGPVSPEFPWDDAVLEKPENFVAYLGLRCLSVPSAAVETLMSPLKLDMVQQELRDGFSSVYGKLASTDPLLRISAIVCVQLYLASLGYEHLARALVEEKMRMSEEGFFRRVGHTLMPSLVASQAQKDALLFRLVATHPVASSMLTTANRWLVAAGSKHKDRLEALVLELASVYSPYCTPETEVIYLARVVGRIAIARCPTTAGNF